MSTLQVRLSSTVQSAFYNGFYRWGDFVGRKPKRVVAISLLVAVLCSARLLMAPSKPLPSVTKAGMQLSLSTADVCRP
jgi:hypothetical protein